jgi:uncharacterized protein (TIGR03083 family)
VTALPELVRAERVAFLDLLETLTPQEWACPSLCGAWTVQEVAAHLAVAPIEPPWHTLALVARYRSINRANAEAARAWARRGPEAIVAQLRGNAADGARPFGVSPALALADAVVHGLDVRRPLARHRAVPPEAFAWVADATLALRGPLTVVVGGSPRKRVRGVRLVADGIDWRYGEGPEMRGSPEALILLLNGRSVGRDEFSGPGAPAVLARLR